MDLLVLFGQGNTEDLLSYHQILYTIQLATISMDYNLGL